MSAYKTITCTFKDEKILINALQNIGYQPIVHKEKQALYGYKNDKRKEQAEIIVSKDQISIASNDLGFSYNEKTKEYIMICSDYDLHLGVADKVKQSYALTAIKTALQKNKFQIKEEKINKKIIVHANKII